MLTFTHTVGETHLYSLAPLKADESAGSVTADTTYEVDHSGIASIEPNHGVANVLQVLVHYLSVGTATITATGTNEDGDTFTTQVQAIATAVPPNNTTHFAVTEIS